MKKWALTYKKGQFKRFVNAVETLKLYYVKYNKPKFITDTIVGEEAQLTLMVLKIKDRQKLTLCVECWKKVCNPDKCGEEDYQEFWPKEYTGTDQTGKVKISLAPWSKLEPLKEEETYVVDGTISEYNGALEIKAKEYTKATTKEIDQQLKDAEGKEVETKEKGDDKIEKIKTAVDTFDGELSKVRFDEITDGWTSTEIENSIARAKIEYDSEDQVWRVRA